MSQLRIWEEFPQLETRRLVLRQITLDDASALFPLFSDDNVTENMDIPSLQNVAQVEQLLEFMEERWQDGYSIRWGIVKKDENTLVGTCGYNDWVKEFGYRGEIGYDLMGAYWGQGIMTEALRAILNYGFESMHLNRIQAMVNPGNDRSISLLRKAGFQYEGQLREYGYWKGKFWDLHSFSLLRREWVKRRP
jgi:ribosomal-protein-alanine N-acetyltransferase